MMKRLLVVGAVVLTTAALAWADSDDQPKAGGAPKPVITEPTKGDRCVEDEAYMRRNHMKLLDHHRDETVIKGIRTKKYSLKECINCHASEKTGSVAAAKGDFCVSCHSYAAVKIDCDHTHYPAHVSVAATTGEKFTVAGRRPGRPACRPPR